MSYDYKQFKASIVDHTLKCIGLYSPEASILLLATMAVESNFGTYIHQIKGPAVSPYQIEPATHEDIFRNFLKFDRNMFEKVNDIIFPNIGVVRDVSFLREEILTKYYERSLLDNLSYATAIARLIYYRVKEPLPKIHPVAMGEYWKHYYNTPKGKGTVGKFVESWDKFIKPHITEV